MFELSLYNVYEISLDEVTGSLASEELINVLFKLAKSGEENKTKFLFYFLSI